VLPPFAPASAAGRVTALALGTLGLALAAAVGAAGVLVLVVRPEAASHKVLAALMLLRAGYMASVTLLPGAPSAATALVLARLSTAWSLAIPFLTLYVAALLWPDALPARRALLAATAAAAVLLGAAFAWQPALFVAGVARVSSEWAMVSGPLTYVATVPSTAALVAFVVAAARVAADELRPEPERRIAGALGLAFSPYLVQSGAFFVSFTAFAPAEAAYAPFVLRAAATIAGGLAVVAYAPRLVRPLGASAGRIVATGAAVLASLGALDGLLKARPDLGSSFSRYDGTDLLLRLLFALVVVLAVARYGLAGAGGRERRRARAALRALFAAAAGALFGLLVMGALGEGGLALGAGALVALAAGLALWRPVDALAERALLAADDPRAVAERARRYAAALAATRGGNGREIPGSDGLLADLRRDLGVTEREHAMLLRGLESRERIGRYVLGAEIGRGATATVYLASDAETGREVVVKRYHTPREGSRLVAEARALQAVQSPRIVRLLDVDRREGDAFLVMERAPGGSAKDLLAREGPLPPERALPLLDDLLEGLAALHAAGLVHGDVKCENLLLDADGRGLLADFGSARAADPGTTLTGAAVEGTLSTMAPEVVRGARPAAASDVYAAGAVLYRLLTGEHPIDLAGADAFSARERILLDAPRLPHPAIPSWLEAPLRAALSKRPEERPADPAAFRAALRAGTPGATARSR